MKQLKLLEKTSLKKSHTHTYILWTFSNFSQGASLDQKPMLFFSPKKPYRLSRSWLEPGEIICLLIKPEKEKRKLGEEGSSFLRYADMPRCSLRFPLVSFVAIEACGP